jgi:SsrA-binding protein
MRATRETLYHCYHPTVYQRKGLAKLEIALAKGKKNYDKRQSLKEKEDKRSMDRALKV